MIIAFVFLLHTLKEVTLGTVGDAGDAVMLIIILIIAAGDARDTW